MHSLTGLSVDSSFQSETHKAFKLTTSKEINSENHQSAFELFRAIHHFFTLCDCPVSEINERDPQEDGAEESKGESNNFSIIVKILKGKMTTSGQLIADEQQYNHFAKIIASCILLGDFSPLKMLYTPENSHPHTLKHEILDFSQIAAFSPSATTLFSSSGTDYSLEGLPENLKIKVTEQLKALCLKDWANEISVPTLSQHLATRSDEIKRTYGFSLLNDDIKDILSENFENGSADRWANLQKKLSQQLNNKDDPTAGALIHQETYNLFKELDSMSSYWKRTQTTTLSQKITKLRAKYTALHSELLKPYSGFKGLFLKARDWLFGYNSGKSISETLSELNVTRNNINTHRRIESYLSDSSKLTEFAKATLQKYQIECTQVLNDFQEITQEIAQNKLPLTSKADSIMTKLSETDKLSDTSSFSQRSGTSQHRGNTGSAAAPSATRTALTNQLSDLANSFQQQPQEYDFDAFISGTHTSGSSSQASTPARDALHPTTSGSAGAAASSALTQGGPAIPSINA